MHTQAAESDYERGRREGRREVLSFLKQYAVTLASPENRGGLLGGMLRKVGSDATDGLAKLVESHFAGRI